MGVFYLKIHIKTKAVQVALISSNVCFSIWLRVTLCTVCAMLVCCLTYTLLTMMILGVGIGYHYCFVQNSVEAMAKAAKAAGALRSGSEATEKGHVMRSIDKMVARGFAHRMSRRDADELHHANITSNNFTVENPSHNKDVAFIDHPPYNNNLSNVILTDLKFNEANDKNYNVTRY